jgi:hypothetical protein
MMKSFRDPSTNVLKAFGHCDVNAPGDLAREESDDFSLAPGEWQLADDAWVRYDNSAELIQAQIDQIESFTLMNRGDREGWMQVIRDKAATLGITDDATIAAENPFFAKLLQVDDQVRALRAQL